MLKSRKNYVHVHLHGEANEISDADAAVAMEEFNQKLGELCEINEVPIQRIFNADQTALYYGKTPNGMYCEAELSKTIRFDRRITVWWINSVFDPWYKRRYGSQKCLILLDNCSSHVDIERSLYPSYITLVFSPPKLRPYGRRS